MSDPYSSTPTNMPTIPEIRPTIYDTVPDVVDTLARTGTDVTFLFVLGLVLVMGGIVGWAVAQWWHTR